MTIGKKLYFGFGAILAIMLVLFFINVITVRREYAAQDTVKATLATKTAISNARSQMMQNRLYLSNYLLSGDLRDEDKTNKGVGDLLALLKDAEAKSTDASLRSTLAQVGDTESELVGEFRETDDREAAPGGCRGRDGFRFADLLPAARSGFVGEQVHGDTGSGR